MNNFLDNFNFKDKRAVITGGTGKIASELALGLLELGCELHLIDKPGATPPDNVLQKADVHQTQLFMHHCDLEDGESRKSLIKQLNALEGPIHFLVNNAAFVGTSDLEGWATTFQKQSVETWRRALEVNLTAVFDLCKGLHEKMSQSGDASIVNISSIYGMVAPDFSIYEGTELGNPAAYAASKGGLIQLTRWLATALASSIRVNCVSPGGVFRGQDEAFVSNYSAKTPLKRMATESDITGLVIFLCSGSAKYITGQNIPVDGGWTVW